MLRNRTLRRTAGAALVVIGALLMWLAPQSAFAGTSGAGLALLIAGIALEAIGIALEHRDSRGR